MDMATGAYSYDTGNRLTGLTYTSNAGRNQIDAFGWGYDAANNVTSFSTNIGTATYGNDVTNQLTSASYTGANQPANEAYSYDANGNRTMAGYTTGSNDLLTSDGTFNYQHDTDGNQTVRRRISSAYATDYQTTSAWDYRNRLTDAESFDNNNVLTKHVHYVYGVFDHLLATEVDTTGSGSYDKIEHYVLDVSPEIPSAGVPGTALAQPLLQFDGNKNLIIRYLEAHDQIFAEGAVSPLTQDDVADFMLTDNLGTVRYVVDQSGTVIDKIDYNSFGQVSYESNPAIHHFAGYTGGLSDGFLLDPNLLIPYRDTVLGSLALRIPRRRMDGYVDSDRSGLGAWVDRSVVRPSNRRASGVAPVARTEMRAFASRQCRPQISMNEYFNQFTYRDFAKLTAQVKFSGKEFPTLGDDCRSDKCGNKASCWKCHISDCSFMVYCWHFGFRAKLPLRTILQKGVEITLTYFGVVGDRLAKMTAQTEFEGQAAWFVPYSQGLLMATLGGCIRQRTGLSDCLHPNLVVERRAIPIEPALGDLFLCIAASFQSSPMERAPLEQALQKSRKQRPKLLFKAWQAINSNDRPKFLSTIVDSTNNFAKTTADDSHALSGVALQQKEGRE